MQMYMFFCEILMMFTKQTSPREEACESIMYEGFTLFLFP